MSKEHRVVDLPIAPRQARGLSEGALAKHAGRRRDSPLVWIAPSHPINPTSQPDPSNNETRDPLDAVQDVIGLGLVFPGNGDRQVASSYLAVDTSAVEVLEDLEDETDVVDTDTEGGGS